MVSNQSTQGLASLGRNGDSMLVHMSPEEVQGLQGLAMAQGGSLTINPYTGMPEAFSLGGFFSSFLPMIAGAAVGGPAGGGLMSSMAPILAGAGTGALLAAAKGEDPLMGGITGGFGGYGGAGLGQSLGKAFGGTTAESMGSLINQGAQQAVGGGAGNLGMFATNLTGATPALGAANFAPGLAQVGSSVGTMPQIGGAANLNTVIPVDKSVASIAGGYTPPPTIAQNLGDLGSGVKNLTGFGDMSIGDAYKKFTDAGGTGMQLAMPIGGAVLGGLEPSDLGYSTGSLYEDPDKNKYRGPQGQLNLSGDTGLRLVAKGGYIDGYAEGGSIATGGVSDLYTLRDGTNAQDTPMESYGLGRLNNLATAQSMDQAKTMGYAEGGETSMNLDKLPTLNVNTGMQSMGESGGGVDHSDLYNRFFAQYGDKLNTPVMANAAGIKSFGDYLDRAQVQGRQYAHGGYLDGQGDGMSDSIPATIEGKQPARLADSEFVLPADVVSHIGNGSSKAGAKRLYAMMDKIRMARTGTKKQGKEINPNKYLPA